ncbi:MAG: hypothetical protein RR687_01350 [Comamonas sp.]
MLLPLTIRSDADLAELVRWFRLLCTSEVLRERFVSGAIALDLLLAPAAVNEPVSMPVSAPGRGMPQQRVTSAPPAGASLAIDESVITEALLRRQHAGGQVVSLKRGAVITPSARDYARTAGIRMERSE